MTKDIIVTLLRKDIVELAQLTDGFEQLTVFPNVLLQLAHSKAEAILCNIDALSHLSANSQAVEQQSSTDGLFPSQNSIEKVMEQTVQAGQEDVQPTINRPEVGVSFTINENIEEERIEPIETEIAASIEEEPIIEAASETSVVDLSEEVNVLAQEDVSEMVIDNINLSSSCETTVLADAVMQSAPITRNDSITHQKIEDIRQAISLGDRFLFQRELFGGNGELMTKTIAYLNNLSSFEDAQRYIAKKFTWEVDNPAVERFMQILNRRFV